MPVLLRESGERLRRRQGASPDRTFTQHRRREHPVGLIFSSLEIRHVDNKVGFFLNLDQGTMSNEQVVRMLAGIGYECIEYSVRHLNPQTMTPGQMRDLVTMTKANGLTISEYVIQREFVHGDASVRSAELDLTVDGLRAAGDLGIPVVNCFTGPAPFMGIGSPILHKEISEGKAWGMVCDACDRIVPVAETCQVKIAIEAVYGMVCRDYYTLAELLRRYDSPFFGVNYDPSHMALHHNTVDWTIRQLKNRIFHCHVKDVAGVVGKVLGDTFVFPFLGEGRVDWVGFFAAMEEIGYDGCLSIEYEAFDYFDTTLKKDLARAAELFYSDYQSLAEQYGSRD